MNARLDALDAEVEAALEPVTNVPYVVLHDACRYLEAHYGMSAVASITIGPQKARGAKRLYGIRKKILASEAVCVFTEPQFEPALVETLLKGTTVKTAVLDPLGSNLSAGPNTYFQLMRGLAASLRGCLTPAS